MPEVQVQSGPAVRTDAPPSLATKLALVMGQIRAIKKRGENTFHHYKYATEADIVAEVRRLLAAAHVVLIPEVVAYAIHELSDKKGKERDPLTILTMNFTFEDGDSGERITKGWLGVGQDAGDKGCYKAMTGAEKYFLMKTFLIPTGDDPEKDEGRRGEVKADRAVKKQRAALPPESGAVYVEKVTPKQKGNVQWYEVTVSTGESFPVQEHRHQLVTLLTELAQGPQAVVLETSVNARGNKELDGVRRWPEQLAAPAAAVNAEDIHF